MTTVMRADADLYRAARRHLRGHVEQVGFFLADFDPSRRAFDLREWRAMPPDAFEIQSSFHVTLRDEVRPELIKWAWDAGLCLVEAHSHREDDGDAVFSSSDLWGFGEWVPHLRWRLQARPYAAVVCAGSTFDALAWVEDADTAEQVERLEVVGDGTYTATGLTLATLRSGAKGNRGD